MNLYTIDKTIEDILEKGCSLNEETGEFYDFDDLKQLHVDREQKIDNTVCYLKNTEAMIAALKSEEKKLSERRKALESKADRIKSFLSYFLDIGKKLETVHFKISWRKSTSVKIENEELIDVKYIKEKVTTSVDKKAIGEALKAGEIVSGAELEEKHNLQIK